MTIVSFSIPDEMKKNMDLSREINWSEVARAAIKVKLIQLKLLRTLNTKSDMTESDALEIGEKINKSLHKRFIE